ncbi:autotransporter domain-containing protein [uncultured Martelella sp.]|uniref:autotransporter outer membrane beta-barrel domain-containing protein n=1 Tax=uncultured Martelella sp. TaxID=392331 RepID=UPI0029C9AFF3|nr:autotransporter domain-containing protein [uncultured Martelella sp.]
MTDIKYCVANQTNARPTGHTLRRFNRHLLAGAVFAATALGVQAPLHAEDWIAGTGDWFNGANWSNGLVPDVNIDNGIYRSAVIENGGEVTLSGGDAVAMTLDIGSLNGPGGTMTVTGGTLNTGNIGIDGGGSMTVSGRGTEWDLAKPNTPFFTSGSIRVWDGSLAISGGAKVLNAGIATLGARAGQTGSLILSGTGTTMTSNVGISVGSRGIGLLRVEDHAILQYSRLEIGTFDGGQGTVVVTGNGTSVLVSDLIVGYRGDEEDRASAILTIADDAQVTASDEAFITNDGNYGGWTSGTINIGAAEGEAAAAAGTLNADNGVYFGYGDANLVFNHTETDYDFSHDMTNSDEATASASIRQVAGVTELSGNSASFTGSTEATGGTLLVTGNLGGVLSASEAGTIGGTGTIGSTTIGDGGTLAPGMRNAIGSLTVNGDLTFESGSTYAVDLTGAASDTVTVLGAATLSGGTVTVRSLDDSTSYQQSQTYTILSAGTLDGSFTETISPSAFLDVTTTYEGDNAKITVALIGSGEGDGGDNGGGDNGGGDNGGGDNGGGSGVFTWAADTPNQYAVAQSLDSLDQSGQSLELYNDMLMLSLDEARETYEQLGGLDYAAGQSAMMQNSLSVGRMINNRLRSASGGAAAPSVPALGYAEESDIAAKGAFPDSATDGFDEGRFTAWGSGFGTWGEIDGTNGSADADIGSGGFIGGADMMVNDMWRVGVAAGYSRSTFDVNQSTGKSDNYTLATYADMEWNALAVRGGLGYTFHSAEADRKITALDQTLKGEYDANSFNAFGELAYRADLGPASVEPFANLAFVHLKTDSFTETGGTAALRVDGQTMSTTFTTIGLRAATDFDFGGVPTVARGSLGWMHAFGDVDTQTTARFATGNDFTVFGTPLDENTALVEAGLDFAVTESATLGVSYSGQFGENATDQGLNANLRVRF